MHFFAGPAAATYLASSGGYGFLATVDNMTSRPRAGKAFISLAEGETVCAPSLVSLPAVGSGAPAVPPASHARGLRVHRWAHPDLRDR